MRKPYPSELADRILLRLPEGMRERIQSAAQANRRSMTGEIVARLQVTFDQESIEIPSFLRHEPEAKATVTESGAVVLHLTLTPGMTVEKVLELLEAAQMALPQGTQLVVDSFRQG